MPLYLPDSWRGFDLLTSGEETIPRLAMTSTRSFSSQALHLAYFTARKTETISQVRVMCTTAAGATPSLIRIGVWTANDAGALLAQVAATANDTTLLAANNTAYTKAFASSFTKQAGQRYAVGLLVVTAASAPQLSAFAGNGSTTEFAAAPRISGFAGSQADLPATLAAGSVSDTASPIYAALLP